MGNPALYIGGRIPRSGGGGGPRLNEKETEGAQVTFLFGR